MAAKNWIFRWKNLDGSPFRGMVALLITAGAFAFFAAAVRIRVNAPQQWIERKASVIQLPADGDGALWRLRAQESGPFPATFDPAEWEKSQGFSESIASALKWTKPPYTPELRALPLSAGPETLSFANRKPVFPEHEPNPEPPPPSAVAKLEPALFPLSGVPMEAMPGELPAFGHAVDAAMTSAPWRFLIELNTDGAVVKCVPMVDEKGGEELAAWLRGVKFSPETAKKWPWLGVGLIFMNRTPTDGPQPR